MRKEQHVLKRFPDHWQSITRLFEQDEDFRVLCIDYADAIEAREKWRGSNDPTAASRVKEYDELMPELESELMQYLAT
jgi:hypothetical protein